MTHTIAIAGKGGTGKTTIAALLVRLMRQKKSGSVLAVDADPNSNLAEALGLQVKQSIAAVLDEIASHPESVPQGMTKERFIEFQVQSAIYEAEGFDILNMGKPEGPGCYCYVNNVLRNLISKLIKSYEYVVIDNEAGLEHFSRRTTRSADTLLVVSDATPAGLRAAARISELVKELKIDAGKKFLLVNRFEPGIMNVGFDARGLEYLGQIRDDAQIRKISLNGGSLLKLSAQAQAWSDLEKLMEKLWRS